MFNRRRRENRELSRHSIRAPVAVKHSNPEKKFAPAKMVDENGRRDTDLNTEDSVIYGICVELTNRRSAVVM